MRARYLTPEVEAILPRKMVFLGGPRQVGKTTLAKSLGGKGTTYLNWDDGEARELLLREGPPKGPGLLVLDEIHKYKNWRQMVKGLFDTKPAAQRILVTGSARLDLYRRGGDSLQGRYRFLRLMPFTFAEIKGRSQGDLQDLLRFSGFPEPFSLKSEKEARIWSRDYRTRLIREDLADLERIQEVSLFERMMIRLPDLVGSPLSLNGLREDLGTSHQTVSRWLEALERLYGLFRIPPFGAAKIRAVKKEQKHYHYDWTLVTDEGPRFENLVAVHLLKWCHYQEDVEGLDCELRYFRDTDGREVDFVVVKDKKPALLIECKTGEKSASKHLRYLKAKFPSADAVQVTAAPGLDRRDGDGIRLVSAAIYLAELI